MEQGPPSTIDLGLVFVLRAELPVLLQVLPKERRGVESVRAVLSAVTAVRAVLDALHQRAKLVGHERLDGRA